MRKRIALWLVILMLVAEYSYGLGFTTEVKAGAIENDTNIITSVTMAVYGPGGETVTGDVYEQGSEVTLNYTWALPDGHSYKAGDTFTFHLPDQFKLFNDISGPLVSDEGDVGSFTVNKDDHLVVMTFNSFIEDHDNVHGTLSFRTKFDKEVIKGSTVQEILFPVNGDTQVVTLRFKPNVASTIEKKGTPEGYNAESIQWSVDVNKTLESVYGAEMNDPIPAGLTVDTVTAAVYQLDVQLDGTVSQGPLVDSAKYTLDVQDGTLKLKFADSPITGAYRIVFSTVINDLTKTKFTNKASFSGDNLPPVIASATVAVQRAPSLQKYAIRYEPSTQTVTWGINYNYNYGTIPQADAMLKDLFNDSQELVPESVKVYNVSVDSDGKVAVGSQLAEGTDYTATSASAVGKTGFKLQFMRDVTTPYFIEYKTKNKGRLFDSKRIYNTVTSGTYNAEYNQDIHPVIIYKTVDAAGADYRNKTVDWKITINEDNYLMDDVVVKDTFPSGGLTFIPESLVVKSASGTVVPASEYTLEYAQPVVQGEGFTVTFKKPITGKYTISYKLRFDYYGIKDGGDKFYNTATVTWDEGTASAKAVFNPRIEVKNNGFKYGQYNAASKEITWSIGANYNGKQLQNAEIVDAIEAPQQLVPGSVKIKQLYLWPNGLTWKMSDLNVKYSVTLGNDNVLRVKFDEPVNYPFYVEFKTTLEGQLINSAKVYNTASIYDGNKKVSGDLTGAVTIPYGGEYVVKSGAQVGDKINWTININRGQSFIRNAKITDVGSANQMLLTDSFHLYPTTVAQDGTPTKATPELVKGTDYTLDITTTNEGKQTFVLSFVKDIKSAYILEYQSLIAARSGETVTNGVTLSGNNVVEVTKETSTEIIVGVSSGFGTGSGSRSMLTIKKLDDNDHMKLLIGATFDLYRLNGSERLLIGTKTTGADGTVIFNGILSGSYVLVETKAPEGYVLDAAEHPVTVGAGAYIVLPITNHKLPSPTPSVTPSPTPSATPSANPSVVPSVSPSANPSVAPSVPPSVNPSVAPSVPPSAKPSVAPSVPPSAKPSVAPSVPPSANPSVAPSVPPSANPSVAPSEPPIVTPPSASSESPSVTPSPTPSATPTASSVTGVIIPDEQIPAGPANSSEPQPSPVPSVTATEVPADDEVPLGGVDIDDDDVPKGGPSDPAPSPATGNLPKTGEGSSLPMYMGGLGLILVGLILNRWLTHNKKTK
ncbi:Collagen binding domain-containing protein [Paenibacillus sophorae]|uniref:Collagen binding domain-containing protein n=2 Tax=Paenibacillus sophorae TaxID=1333845 RepID=A0A1H8NC95_9BACL|nr:Collagen binding domain-containing protein [Paenibacillus sophorae]